MPYEQKPNSGTLFKNDRKTSDKHPDYQGTWKDANGKEWSFAAWVKDGAKGKFFSLSASERQPKPQQTDAPKLGSTPTEDELPF